MVTLTGFALPAGRTALKLGLAAAVLVVLHVLAMQANFNDELGIKEKSILREHLLPGGLCSPVTFLKSSDSSPIATSPPPPPQHQLYLGSGESSR